MSNMNSALLLNLKKGSISTLVTWLWLHGFKTGMMALGCDNSWDLCTGHPNGCGF